MTGFRGFLVQCLVVFAVAGDDGIFGGAFGCAVALVIAFDLVVWFVDLFVGHRGYIPFREIGCEFLNYFPGARPAITIIYSCRQGK